MKSKLVFTAVFLSGFACALLLVVSGGILPVHANPPSGNGDVNGDGTINLADAIYLLTYLFGGGPTPVAIEIPECPSVCPTLVLPGNVPLEMVYCPPGTFMMGRYPDEQDSNSIEDWQHQVTLTRGFCLGKYEVTKRQWQAVMGTTPWAGQEYVLDEPESPAVYVTWIDAQAFVSRVNEYGQGTYSLPTEAQWEYACRAGTTTRFYWGDDPTYSEIDKYAWHRANAWNVGLQYAHVVGQKLPNAWGLYDMSGNAYEWCEDWWVDSYPAAAVTDPTGPLTGSDRVIRGCSFFSSGLCSRSASRSATLPDRRGEVFGFRLARVLPPTTK